MRIGLPGDEQPIDQAWLLLVTLIVFAAIATRTFGLLAESERTAPNPRASERTSRKSADNAMRALEARMIGATAIKFLLPRRVIVDLQRAREWVRSRRRHTPVRGRVIAHRGTLVDRTVVDMVFKDRDYDLRVLRRYPEIIEFYRKTERPLILDAGANIGASAVWFAQEFPNANIVAIEPERENFALLERNVAGLNVKPVFGAIAGKAGTLQVYDPGEGEWGYRTGASHLQSRGEVRAFSVAELVTESCQPFILKIDIEGAESDVFGGPTDLISQFPVVIVELHDWLLPRGGTSRPFLRWQASQDRDLIHIRENIFSLCNQRLPKLMA